MYWSCLEIVLFTGKIRELGSELNAVLTGWIENKFTVKYSENNYSKEKRKKEEIVKRETHHTDLKKNHI